MRYFFFLVISLVCFDGAAAYAQTADDLIARNIKARGGLERIKAIKTIRVTGKIKGFGGRVMGMGEEKARPDLVRVTTTMQGMTAIDAYDGTTGWQVEPFGGR